MAKKLKTGDVTKIRVEETWNIWPDSKWVAFGAMGSAKGCFNRKNARFWKARKDRIARILSIGPKYVTVRISK